MYDLKNAAILAYDNWKVHLVKFDYFPVAGTVGLWKHEIRRTRFCLCFDDFWGKSVFETRHTTLTRSNKKLSLVFQKPVDV